MGKSGERLAVDWDKVPVVITGTPDEEALRALWADVAECQAVFSVQQSAISGNAMVERASLVVVSSVVE